MRTRPISLSTALAVAASVLAFTPTASAEDPVVPFEQRYYTSKVLAAQNPSSNLVVGLVVRISNFADEEPEIPPAAGITVNISATSCGNFLKSADWVTDGEHHSTGLFFTLDGQLSFGSNRINELVGRSIEYTVTISEPGFAPYEYNQVIDGYVRRPRCSVINAPTDALVVTKWSQKVSERFGTAAPYIGARSRVTPTRAEGAEIRYRWTLNGKTVDRDRGIDLTRRMKGKRLAMKVTVIKNGEKKTKTLSYGRVRRR